MLLDKLTWEIVLAFDACVLIFFADLCAKLTQNFTDDYLSNASLLQIAVLKLWAAFYPATSRHPDTKLSRLRLRIGAGTSLAASY